MKIDRYLSMQSLNFSKEKDMMSVKKTFYPPDKQERRMSLLLVNL